MEERKSPNNVGFIALIFKFGNINKLNNWWSIMLQNAALTIIIKALQFQSQHHIMHIIIKQWPINLSTIKTHFDNVFFTLETIDWTIRFNPPLVLLQQNFTKAYDKVSWVFLFNTMERLRMFQEFVNLVSLLIKDVKTTMCVNGNITPYFHVHKGVRQGCPLTL
jgi:hypothetical protein